MLQSDVWRLFVPSFRELTEEGIEAAAAKTGRSCGACSLCCLTLDIPEVKPPGGQCPHCKPGAGGCMIHDRRPTRCRTYSCLWLTDDWVPDHWRPLNSKMFIDIHVWGTPQREAMLVHMHPKHPNRWREEPWYGELKIWAARMLARKPPIGIYVTTHGNDIYRVLPDRDLKISRRSQTSG
jgi:hypothetical protein